MMQREQRAVGGGFGENIPKPFELAVENRAVVVAGTVESSEMMRSPPIISTRSCGSVLSWSNSPFEYAGRSSWLPMTQTI